MQSMTGYGLYSEEADALQIAVRIRSVNHRNLDLVLRMPEEYRSLELEMRQRLGERLRRGRIELRLDVEDLRERAFRVVVNKSWIAALARAREELEGARLDLDRLRLSDLLKIPDAVRISTASSTVDEESSAAVLAALSRALDDLEASRVKEGQRLHEHLEAQLTSLAEKVAEISAEKETLGGDQADRLRQRVEELLAGVDSLDEGRLEQEVALLAERSDVREELDRLITHIAHFRDTMVQDGAIGKKLDFIAQEISRELGTLGAKCRQSKVLQRQLEAKLICEQMREQVQNIE